MRSETDPSWWSTRKRGERLRRKCGAIILLHEASADLVRENAIAGTTDRTQETADEEAEADLAIETGDEPATEAVIALETVEGNIMEILVFATTMRALW